MPNPRKPSAGLEKPPVNASLTPAMANRSPIHASVSAPVGLAKAPVAAPAPAVKPVEAKVEIKAAPKAPAPAPVQVVATKAAPVAKAPPVSPETPKMDAPRVEDSKIEAPKIAAAKVTAPKIAVPKVAAPKIEAPKIEAPKIEALKATAKSTKAATAKSPARKTPAPKAAAAKAPAARAPAPKAAGSAAAMLQPVSLMQENLRANTEKALTAFRGRYAEAKALAETATSRLEDSVKAAQVGSKALGFKMFEIVKAETDAQLDQARLLATAKSLPELLSAQHRFLLAQFERAQARGKDVASLASKVANDVSAPFQASLSAMLRR